MSKMNITIFISSSLGNALQDLEWPENHPLGGSETAALRLAQALKRLGENVQIITEADQLTQHHCDIFISLRIWQVFHQGLYPGKRNYLWCQDDSDQPLVKPLEDPQIAKPIYEKLDGVILLSHYAAQRWISTLNVPVNKIIMTTNGIPLHRFQPHPDRLSARKPWAYYSSTPFRGLELLLLAWPHILQAVPEAQLHICSSMKVYDHEGKTDAAFNPLYEKAKSLAGVQYHGSLSQSELRKVAQQCRVLAYPCIFPETSCIAAMEAMAAGCVVVSTALGALPETAWQNPLVPIADGWLDQWMVEVIRMFKANKHYEQKALQNLTVAKVYDWNSVAKDWMRFLTR
jgi:glycosyltransferase involved in cell wall biosynthesis